MSINEKVEELAEAIKGVDDGLVLEGSEIKEEKPGSVYESTLPEDLSIKTIKRVSDHNTLFNAAATKVVGEMAVEAMASDNSIDRVTGSIKMVGDKLGFTVDREKTYANPLGDGKPVVKHGVVNVNYTVKAGKNAGQLKAVRQSINELASKELAK